MEGRIREKGEEGREKKGGKYLLFLCEYIDFLCASILISRSFLPHRYGHSAAKMHRGMLVLYMCFVLDLNASTATNTFDTVVWCKFREDLRKTSLKCNEACRFVYGQ